MAAYPAPKWHQAKHHPSTTTGTQPELSAGTRTHLKNVGDSARRAEATAESNSRSIKAIKRTAEQALAKANLLEEFLVEKFPADWRAFTLRKKYAGLSKDDLEVLLGAKEAKKPKMTDAEEKDDDEEVVRTPGNNGDQT